MPEFESRFIIIVACDIIVEYPPAMLGATRLVHQKPGFISLSGRKMPDNACGAVRLPRV